MFLEKFGEVLIGNIIIDKVVPLGRLFQNETRILDRWSHWDHKNDTS